MRRHAKKRHPARTSISCWREHILQGNKRQWIEQGALSARNKLPCLIHYVLLSTNFGSRPLLRQGILVSPEAVAVAVALAVDEMTALIE